jgi:hypothetical protein
MIVRSAEDPQRFIRLAAHDSERGRVHAVSISHDECFALSAGADGCLCVHKIIAEVSTRTAYVTH